MRIFPKVSLRVGIGLFILQVVASIFLFNFGPLSEPDAFGGAGLLDSQTGNSAADIYASLDAYGAEGRGFYTAYLRRYDFVYGILSAVAFGGFLLAVSAHVRWWSQWLVFLPVTMAVLDILENIGMLTLLANYPAQLTGLANLVGITTTLKVGLVNVTFLLILLSILALIVQWVGNRQRDKQTRS